MKKLLTLVALVALAVFTGLGVAQEERKGATGQEAQKALQLLKVKVLEVNDSAKTFTGMLNGKAVTFHLPDLKSVTFHLPDLKLPAKGSNILAKGSNIIDMRGDPRNPGDIYFDVENDPITQSLPTICGGRWVCHSSPPFLDFGCFCYGNLRMTGKVTQVDEGAKSFTVMVKGKSFTFDAMELKAAPKVGETMDVTYTKTTPNGPFKAINLNSSRSNVD